MLERVEGRHFAREVVAELALLSSAMVARGQSTAAPSGSEMLDFVTDTAGATAANWSSMHQDVSRKRKTEVEQLNGWIVAKARALGLHCEHNEWLARHVRRLQPHE